ncbi:diacylglycerol/lipid kinase family protein [Echinicola shivajiensis]|uniref:diacylglycerol/lipid kinase family protein n=1 Tax=Echinicola shivajiensis TaxID=1035916 RepID=UPI001BFCD1FE|nr:diacylglycerol kinase family protein [Echinicola shivajiensis]
MLEKKQRIHFIVNPISGKGNNFLDKILLKEAFTKSQYEVFLKITSSPGHASKLAQIAITEGADIIVACGGDGTINEIASCLVGHDILLGIIPLGSGNGLASNLQIPLKIDKAIEIIINGNVKNIDIGKVNGKYFFSNMGIGFDAALIAHYNRLKQRQLKGYLKALIKTMGTYSSTGKIKLVKNGKECNADPFLLFVSNSNRMGYGFTLTPKANISDGLLDMVLVKKMSRLKLLLFGLLVASRKIHALKEVNYQLIENLVVLGNGNLLQYQIDGELVPVKENQLEISLCKEKLKVLVP